MCTAGVLYHRRYGVNTGRVGGHRQCVQPGCYGMSVGRGEYTTPFHPQIKIKGVQIKIRGLQIKITGYQIKIRGHQIKIKGFQIKIKGFQIKIRGLQNKIKGIQIKTYLCISLSLYVVTMHFVIHRISECFPNPHTQLFRRQDVSTHISLIPSSEKTALNLQLNRIV